MLAVFALAVAAALDASPAPACVLVERGAAVAPQPLPPLGTGVQWAEQLKEPLPVTIRYVLEKGAGARNNCSTANDTLTKTF
ncbi:MAG: hypothetical protein NVS3B28_08230 [Candidatus Velthaea sp.]